LGTLITAGLVVFRFGRSGRETCAGSKSGQEKRAPRMVWRLHSVELRSWDIGYYVSGWFYT
jgi:hypothetical protein